MPRYLLMLAFICFVSCGNDSPSGSGDEEPPGEDHYRVTEAFPNLTFSQPIDLQQPDDGTGRLFVAEKRGIIYVFDNDSAVDEQSVFLDIRDRVDDSGFEEGLLGFAFHPDFITNGYLYVNYTTSEPEERTVISRFEVGPNAGEADPASEEEILSFEQPYDNHNGGQLAFGPDGYLYIAVGDGGAGGDPHEHGQDRGTLLGTLLRIDVDNAENGNSYAIPPNNPFAGNDEGYREEIFAYGLRNPWRFSFDADDGTLWTGDVGQDRYEEINIIEAGGNYGWNIMEGNHCFDPPDDCDRTGLEMPVWEYDHSQGDVSVTGGFIYRGSELADLRGLYIYADFASGRIWALDITDTNNPDNTLLLQADFSISSFGTDLDNELYICGFDNGNIYRLEIDDS